MTTTKRNTLFFLLFSVFFTFNSNAQLADGSTCPNFTLDDINGVNHDLHSYLSSGQGAVIDISALWCPPCWSYHQGGTLEALWSAYGGNEAMVFWIEGHGCTAQGCIDQPAGCNTGCPTYPNNMGDWTAGVTYPIINPPSGDANAVNNNFNVSAFPTLYYAGPNFKIYNIGQKSFNEWSNWIQSGTLTADPQVMGEACSVTKDIILNPSGGFGGLNFNWSNGMTTENLYGVEDGSYYVTITDSNSAPNSGMAYDIELGPIVVGSGVEVFVDLIEYGDVDCNGNGNGYLIVEASGNGTYGPFTYSWNTGDSAPAIYNLEGGTYELTVTDINTGCQAFDFYSVVEPSPLNANLTSSNADCDGENGIINVEAYGGVGPYQMIYDGDTYSGNSVPNIPAGTHDLEIIDANGCSITESILVEQNVAPIVDTAEPDILNCYNPSIQLNADSSSTGMGIAYYWTLLGQNNMSIPLDTAYQIMVDTVGTYVLEVYDSIVGCSAMDTIIVAQNFAEPFAQTSANGIITCENASVLVSGDGSSASVNNVYEWTTDNGNIVSSPSPLEIMVDQPGEYILTVIDTLNGCSVESIISVDANLNTPQIELVQAGSLDCNETNTTIDIVQNAGESYSWTTPDGNINGMSNSSSITIDAPGTYIVEVTNESSACTSTKEFVINQDISMPGVALQPVGTVDCNTPQISLATSNNSDYSYTWSTDDGNIIGASDQSSIMVDAAGQYTLEVLDNTNGCTNSRIVDVESALDDPEIISEHVGKIDCLNDDATIETAFNPDYNYSWTTTNGNIQGSTNGAIISVTQGGDYSLEVIDQTNGCNSVMSFNVPSSLEAPDVELMASGTIDCSNPEVTISVTQNMDYTYSWTSDAGGIVTGAQSPDLVVNGAANYTLLVVDQTNGCEMMLNVEVDASTDIPEVDLISQESLDCTTSQAIIEVSQNDNYAYNWTSDDGNIISGANGAVVTVDAVGSYTLELTDETNGCSVFYSYLIEGDADAPSVDLVSSGTISCDAPSVIIEVSTNASYSFNWTTMNGNILDGGNSNAVEVDAAGTYALEVINNSNGCSESFSYQVEEDLEEPTLSLDGDGFFCQGASTTICVTTNGDNFDWIVDGQVVASNQNCYEVNSNQSLMVVASNGNGCSKSETINISEAELSDISIADPQIIDCVNPSTELAATVDVMSDYTFEWFDDAGFIVGDESTTAVNAAGRYTVVVTQKATMCSSEASIDVEEDDTMVPSANFFSVVNELVVKFTNTSTGTIDGYTWDFGDGSVSSEENPDHVYSTAGIYTVCLSADNKCGVNESCVEVIASETLETGTKEQNDITCNGAADGRISLDPQGGIAPYTFEWTGPNGFSSIDQNISDLEAGTYSVVVTDAVEESYTESFDIAEPELLSTTGDITDSTVDIFGSIVLSIEGGVDPYMVMWEDGSDELERTGLKPGMYTVVVSDANGCETTETYEVGGVTSVDEISLIQSFKLAPNPAKDYFEINLILAQSADIKIEIISSVGQLLTSSSLNGSIINERIDVAHFDAGLYFVKLSYQGKISLRKIIVSN